MSYITPPEADDDDDALMRGTHHRIQRRAQGGPEPRPSGRFRREPGGCVLLRGRRGGRESQEDQRQAGRVQPSTHEGLLVAQEKNASSVHTAAVGGTI